MRKSKLNRVKRFPVFLGAVLLLITLFSCKSPSRAYSVKPMALLESENDLFVSVPKDADPEFLKKVLLEFSGNVSENDINKIMARVEKAYCGISENKKGYSLESAVVCNIPKSFAPSIFTSKRGFSKLLYNHDNEKFEIYNQNNLNFVFPESNLLCVTQNKDVPPMLDRYVNLKNTGIDASGNEDVNSDFDYQEFLEGADDHIRFYTANPLFLISKLAGNKKIPSNFSLVYASGTLSKNPDNPETFLTEMDLCFENPLFVKAGKVIFAFFFALGSPEFVIDNDNPSILSIKGIELEKRQIYSILLN